MKNEEKHFENFRTEIFFNKVKFQTEKSSNGKNPKVFVDNAA